jgi:phosphate-selective porin OprO/OprP
VEGVFAKDFSYRLLLEFGGSGTEAQGRINDAYVMYTGLAPFAFQLGAYSPPANLADGTATEDLLFIERATPAELSRALAGADGRFGLGVRVNGARGLAALTFTGRTATDPEVFDSQQAVVGRLGGLVLTAPDYNVHLGANGTYVLQPPDLSGAVSNRYGIRFRDRPEIRVDSTRLIDTGVIDAEHAYSAGFEFAANWKNLLLQAENYWYGIEPAGFPRVSAVATPQPVRRSRRRNRCCPSTVVGVGAPGNSLSAIATRT